MEIRTKAKNVHYVLSPADLRQLQIIQLEILLELDRICKKHNIQYSLAYGTLLGAVRHQGFIPWDDDMDVFMLRKEYDRFCEICVDELDKTRFYLQTHFNTAGYRWGYAKMRRNSTEYIRKGQEHLQYPSGVSIDVFPLDSVPDRKILRPFFNFACFLTRKFLWSEAGKKCESNPVKRWTYWLMAKIPKEVVFRRLYDRLVCFCGDKETDQVRVITLPNQGSLRIDELGTWICNIFSSKDSGSPGQETMTSVLLTSMASTCVYHLPSIGWVIMKHCPTHS